MSDPSAPLTNEINAQVALLASPDFETCLRATDKLANFGAVAIPATIAALDSPKTGFGAIQTLAKIGQPAIEPLIELLADARVDAFAAEALGKIGRPAVPLLVERLQNGTDGQRSWAATVLGWIGDPRAIAPLQHSVDDESAEVRSAARDALTRLGLQG